MAETKGSPLKQIILLVVVALLIAGGLYKQRKNFQKNRAANQTVPARSTPYQQESRVMGTYATVTFYDADDKRNEKGAAAAFKIFHDVNSRFSNYVGGIRVGYNP